MVFLSRSQAGAQPICMPGRELHAHRSSTTTLAPLAASWVAVVSPPMPEPMMTASYSTSVSALAAEPAPLAAACLPGASGATTAAERVAAAAFLRRGLLALCACTTNLRVTSTYTQHCGFVPWTQLTAASTSARDVRVGSNFEGQPSRCSGLMAPQCCGPLASDAAEAWCTTGECQQAYVRYTHSKQCQSWRQCPLPPAGVAACTM